MLTQHLRELEHDGVVSRQIFDEMPLRVEYSLTKYGQTLRPRLRVLCDWGSKHEAYIARSGPRPIPRAEPPAPKRWRLRSAKKLVKQALRDRLISGILRW
jgi:hypothetical protein